MIFLRPWFLLLLVMPLVLKMFRERRTAASDWKQVIDKRLLPYLLVRGTSTTAGRRRIFQIALWSLLTLALAGPAWDKTEVPTRTMKPATVIVAELGPMMTGENLSRLQQKIADTLTFLAGEQVGLVLYDRYGYTAGPLTFETDIIRNMIPYLNQSLLPESVSDPVAGFNQAARLLANADIAEGRILFLTTGANLPAELFEIAREMPHKIAVLGIGGAEPHPIPLENGGFLTDKNGRTVMVRFDPAEMKRLGAFRHATPDESDLAALLAETEPDVSVTERLTGQNIAVWQDRGVWLVVVALPFFAWLFRRQMLLFCLMILWVFPVEAGWWKRADQEAYEYQLRAIRSYKRQHYETAEKMFAADQSAEGLYNKGNALAFQYKIDEAIAAYRRALDLNPQHQDAKFNKEYLERQKEQPPQDPPSADQNQNDQAQNNQNQNDQAQNNQNRDQPPQNPPDQADPQTQQNSQDQADPQPPQNPPDQADPQTQQNSPDQADPQTQQNPPDQADPQTQQSPQDREQSQDANGQNQNNPDPNQPESETDDQSRQNPPSEQNRDPSDQDRSSSETEPDSSFDLENQVPQSPFDQESERILNQLPPEEDNVLRYRIRKQYQRYMKQ